VLGQKLVHKGVGHFGKALDHAGLDLFVTAHYAVLDLLVTAHDGLGDLFVFFHQFVLCHLEPLLSCFPCRFVCMDRVDIARMRGPGSAVPGSRGHCMPFTSGIRQSSSTMPASPTRMPGTIMLHSMVMHMPTPSASAPTMASSTVPTALPVMRIAGLPCIRRRTISMTSSTARPAAPSTTPGRAAFHSATRHMHMPSANRMPPTVPKIRDTKFSFFMGSYLLSFLACGQGVLSVLPLE